MITLTGMKVDPSRLAILAHKAENEFVGLPCGIMDQTIVATGKAGFAMLLERRAGQNAPQGWEFYAITGTLFLTLAFPGFVYRYLLRRHS